MKRNIETNVVACMMLLSIAFTAWSQQPQSKDVLKLLNQNTAAVLKTLGKPDKTYGSEQGSWVRYKLGAAPHFTYDYMWNNGKMTSCHVPGAATWKAALIKYGLKAEGVTPKATSEEGVSRYKVSFRLNGLKGLPGEWEAVWEADVHQLKFTTGKFE